MATIGNRYDRQIRLWGDSGQKSIEQAGVCVLGSSVLATEILKNLILPGIGHFCIVDDVIVDESELGRNFFVKAADVGKLRAAVTVSHLSELNPSVKGRFLEYNPGEVSPTLLRDLLDFDIVIVTNMDERSSAAIGEHLFHHGIYFVYARVCGMFGYVRLCLRQHTVWNVHQEHPFYDFRLDEPFEELLQMADSEKLDEMDHERHSHTPYVLLYLKALAKWRSAHSEAGAIPDTSAKRRDFQQILLSMRVPNEQGVLEEENFNEAKRNMLKSFHTKKISDEVAEVFRDIKTAPIDEIAKAFDAATDWREFLQPFWIYAAALRKFIDRHNGRLPLSGKLPDMTSDSARYVRLQEIYRNKALKHADEVFRLANEIFAVRRKFFADFAVNSVDAGYASDAPNNALVVDPTTKTRLNGNGTSGEPGFLMSSLNPVSVLPAVEGRSASQLGNVIRSGIHLTASSNRMDVDEMPSTTGVKTVVPVTGNGGEDSNDADDEALFRQELSWSDCLEFCKNASRIAVQRGTSLAQEQANGIKSLLDIITRSAESGEYADQSEQFSVHPLLWVLLMKAMDRFWYQKDRYPGTNGVPCTIDARDLKRRLLELIDEAEDEEFAKNIGRLVPDATIDEVCRYGAAELHSISAIMGGVIAQETIKLITHQYLPLDNALIYDGHSQNAALFSI